jgi:hypothetical protein
MIQRSSGTGFLFEPAKPIRISAEGGRQHLDRDVPAEPRIARAIDLPL